MRGLEGFAGEAEGQARFFETRELGTYADLLRALAPLFVGIFDFKANFCCT